MNEDEYYNSWKWKVYKVATRIYDKNIPIIKNIADKVRDITYFNDNN